jgi:hypothetical protein
MFRKENWETRTGIAKGAAPKTFIFWNEDDDTLTGAGYFPADLGIKTGDMVEVIADDSATAPTWLKLTVANGVATAAVAS